MVVLESVDATSCEWRLGYLCWLALCLCIEQLAYNPLHSHPLPFGFGLLCFGSCVAYRLNGIQLPWKLPFTRCFLLAFGGPLGCLIVPLELHVVVVSRGALGHAVLWDAVHGIVVGWHLC